MTQLSTSTACGRLTVTCTKIARQATSEALSCPHIEAPKSFPLISCTKSMPWRTPNLPNEILGNVLVGLGVHDLTRTSLVSHSWQMLSFRYLYHTVYLTVADDLIRFSERLSHQHDNQLSIALYTRQLIIDRTFNSRARNCNRIVDEDDLQLLATIILKLTRLEHFAFKVGFAPHNPQLFQALRECRVKSFDWFIVEEPGTLNYFGAYHM